MNTTNKTMRVRSGVATTATLLAALCAAPLRAGDLNPPGPVASTFKELEEVEPRVILNDIPGSGSAVHSITEPGSYYLIADIVGANGLSGVEVLANGVTIDCVGFALRGVAGSNFGVTVPAEIDGLIIRNGTVRDWGSHGISAANAAQSTIERLTVIDNGLAGMILGQSPTVRYCVVTGNGSTGILALDGESVIEACIARDNVDIGVESLGSGSIRACVSEQQGVGFLSSDISTFISNSVTYRGCVSRNQTAEGFRLGKSSRVVGCVSQGSGAGGFRGLTGSAIFGSAAYQNDTRGFGAEEIIGCAAFDNASSLNNSTLIGGDINVACTAYQNTNFTGISGGIVDGCSSVQNNRAGIIGAGAAIITGSVAGENLNGIEMTFGAVTRCVSSFNTDAGFNMISESSISQCIASSNDDEGIIALERCSIRENLVLGNAEAIQLTLGSHRVDSNLLVANTQGIIINGGSLDNIVMRNFITTTGQYPVSASSAIAPVDTDPAGAVPFANFEPMP